MRKSFPAKSQRELLELIRRRPAMCLGEKSLTALAQFLSGYTVACRIHGTAECDQLGSLVDERFECWLREEKQIGGEGAGWDSVILQESPDEEAAFDHFFKLLDEFDSTTLPVSNPRGETSGNAIILSRDESCTISHAIWWVLNLPFEYMFPPLLGESERHKLERLREGLHAPAAGPIPVALTFGEPLIIKRGRMRLPTDSLWMMRRALGAFYGEMLHSPTEFEVVTGLAWRTFEPLLARLKAVHYSLPCRSHKEIEELNEKNPFRNTSLDHRKSAD